MDCLPSGPVCLRVWVTAVSRPGHNGVLSIQDGLFGRLASPCNPCCSGYSSLGVKRIKWLSSCSTRCGLVVVMLFSSLGRCPSVLFGILPILFLLWILVGGLLPLFNLYVGFPTYAPRGAGG